MNPQAHHDHRIEDLIIASFEESQFLCNIDSVNMMKAWIHTGASAVHSNGGGVMMWRLFSLGSLLFDSVAIRVIIISNNNK